MKKLLLLLAMFCCLQANAAKRGDVNGDNNVDVSDINIVINEILGKGGTYNADVNGDGTTDVSDINIVINIILGKDTPEDDHEYVDLGLPGGVLWATCNVGADKPEESGLYFAWGETKGYAKGESHSFDWANYDLCNGSSSTMTKYCTSSSYGIVDNHSVLEAKDDAATANWGAGWRMPTLQEIKDLYDSKYTTTEWVTVNGVSGRKITSKSNGNNIFLPAAGFRYVTSLSSEGSYGYYWSSSLYTYYSDNAYGLYFNSGGIDCASSNRYCGRSVRAVRVEKAKR